MRNVFLAENMLYVLIEVFLFTYLLVSSCNGKAILEVWIFISVHETVSQ